jgi:hypothetical protein
VVTEGKGALATLATLATLGGCTLITDSFLTNDFSGDPFPIAVDTSTGAIVVGLRQDGQPDRVAVLDLLSPITTIESGNENIPSLYYADLTLLGKRAGSDLLDLPRARFVQAQVITIHPCDFGDETCTIGEPAPAAQRGFSGILGADTLAGDDVRLRLGDDQLFILPDVGGDDRARSLDCDAVFRSPYRGGGTLVPAGTELPFGNRRIAVQACLGQDEDPFLGAAFSALPEGGTVPPLTPTMFTQRGANVLLVVSTSIGISILGETAYERYRLTDLGARPLPELADRTVYLPSGPVTGKLATITRLALVAAPTSNALSPCRQLYAHRILAALTIVASECLQNSQTGTIDCPCKLGDAFCPVPAILELGQLAHAATDQPAPPGAIDFLIVPDTDPTLQALRTELRPDQPEVDGILGTAVLRAAEIDVDYPHDRLVARCAVEGTCKTLPQLAQTDDRCQINHCMYDGPLGDLGCPAASSP